MSKKMSIITKAIAIVFVLALAFACLVACDNQKENGGLDTSKPVSLIIAGRSSETWPAMEEVISKFEKKYTNCTVTYEYMQGVDETVVKRLAGDSDKVDIFVTSNIQEGNVFLDYAYDFLSEGSRLDLSQMNTGLVDNFRLLTDKSKLYAVPYGGEMRGLYVNKTLLNKFGLEVPTKRSELLHCCEVLYAAGYIPLQGDPSGFAQQILYPSICNKIANAENYEETYNKVDSICDGISELFRDEYSFLYELVEKGYYDYSRVQRELFYTFNGLDVKSKEFLNITDTDKDKVYEKQDDIGACAFMTETQAFQLYLKKAKNDYHSEIDYEFTLFPFSEEGGYAYLSPSSGLAVNKHSDNKDWAVEFLNFFFSEEVNNEFAEAQGCIPNTENALLQYNAPDNRACTVGEVTFSYAFYKTVVTLMLDGYKNTYVPVTDKFIEANPDIKYFCKVEKDYVELTPEYKEANPDATIYYKDPDPDMTGVSKINNPKYMKVDYDYADSTYRSENPSEKFYYMNDEEEWIVADAEFIEINPEKDYYVAKYSLPYTLDEYMARLEKEFQKAKALKLGLKINE